MNYEAIYAKIETIGGKYLAIYMGWITEKLSVTESLTVLTWAVMVAFALVIYLWFRNRE